MSPHVLVTSSSRETLNVQPAALRMVTRWPSISSQGLPLSETFHFRVSTWRVSSAYSLGSARAVSRPRDSLPFVRHNRSPLRELWVVGVSHLMDVSDLLRFAQLTGVIRCSEVNDKQRLPTLMRNTGLCPLSEVYDAALRPLRCPVLLLYPFQSSKCGGPAIRHHHGFRCPS